MRYTLGFTGNPWEKLQKARFEIGGVWLPHPRLKNGTRHTLKMTSIDMVHNPSSFFGVGPKES
jgi:hypothetical protein